MNTRFSINVFNLEVKVFFGVFKRFNAWKTGITNRCKDGQFVLFLDYDLTPIEWIMDELHHLQDECGVGDVYVFKTAKGFHCVNTEKRSFSDVLRLMQLTSCDPNYIAVPLRYGKKAWTLRVSDKRGKRKITYEGTSKGVNKLVMSRPHNWLLRELYGVKIGKGVEDGEKHFYKSKYPLTE